VSLDLSNGDIVIVENLVHEYDETTDMFITTDKYKGRRAFVKSVYDLPVLTLELFSKKEKTRVYAGKQHVTKANDQVDTNFLGIGALVTITGPVSTRSGPPQYHDRPDDRYTNRYIGRLAEVVENYMSPSHKAWFEKNPDSAKNLSQHLSLKIFKKNGSFDSYAICWPSSVEVMFSI
jgi:hypothetical protein